MLRLIRWQHWTMAVPLSQLAALDPDDSSAEAIAKVQYWALPRIYCFGKTFELSLGYIREHSFPIRDRQEAVMAVWQSRWI
jgi:hypothetical protein